jgi:hypothetical protein
MGVLLDDKTNGSVFFILNPLNAIGFCWGLSLPRPTKNPTNMAQVLLPGKNGAWV